MTKEEKFNLVRKQILDQGFHIEKEDMERPWGGFFVIDEKQSSQFVENYFPEAPQDQKKISPKILLVAPGKKLSWQYHHRRSEMWRVIQGTAGVIRSMDDHERSLERLSENNLITLQQGQRHRLVGLEDWAVIAEIWIHNDPQNPSDEEDIIRIQDDFGR